MTKTRTFSAPTCFRAGHGTYTSYGTTFSASNMGLAYMPLKGRKITQRVDGLIDFVVLDRRSGHPVGILYKPNPGVQAVIEQAFSWKD